MQKIRFRFIFSILLLLSATRGYSQYIPLYSQYLLNGMIINPAYNKGEDALTFTGFYKKQWSGRFSGPSTFSATIHNSTHREQQNFGLAFLHDDVLFRTQNDMMISYAYRIKTGKGKLGLGLSGGASFFNLDPTIDAKDKDDQTLENLQGLRIYPRLGMGLWYNTPDFFAGISAPQWLLATNQEKIPPVFRRTLVATAGYKMKLSETFKVQPSFLLKQFGGSPVQIDYTILFCYKNLLNTGISYRTKEVFILICQLMWNRYTFGYAYDFPGSRLAPYSTGSHEVVLRYNIKYGLDLPDTRRF